MGTVAIRRPPTVLFSEAHAGAAGQHLSPGKQRQLEVERRSSEGDAMAVEARAATVTNQAFMVERCGK
jgi:hypothetical protein